MVPVGTQHKGFLKWSKTFLTGTRTQIPLHIAWTKTIHSVQGHSAGQTPANQTHYAIKINSIQLGERKHESMKPGPSYMVISRATTIRCLGHMATIPNKCMKSEIYFESGTFPSSTKCITHVYSKKEEYIKVKKCSAWVASLDKQKGKNTLLTTIPKIV
jgi:hypothetical protein